MPHRPPTPSQARVAPATQLQNTHRWRAAVALLLAGAALWWATPAQAQGAAIFRGADLALGEQLIQQHRCAQCHAEKVGGDGSGIYRPLGRINTAGLLRGMVEQCNAMLNFQMFPEEVTAVAAVLNRDHYKFDQDSKSSPVSTK